MMPVCSVVRVPVVCGGQYALKAATAVGAWPVPVAPAPGTQATHAHLQPGRIAVDAEAL